MKKVILMRGPSGAGKSTYIKDMRYQTHTKYQTNGEVLICSADHFFIDYSSVEKEYKFDPTKIGEAHAACLLDFCRGLRDGRQLIVVDNTFIYRWEMDHYVEMALAVGYEVQVVQFMPTTIGDARVCAGRAKAPAATVYRMCCEMELWPSGDIERVEGVEVTVLSIDRF